MTYQELLESKNWREKRKDILRRDLFKCQHCKNSRVIDQLNFGRFVKLTSIRYGQLVTLDSIQEGVGTVVHIDKESAKQLKPFCMVYYGLTARNRKKVFGIRKLSALEKQMFQSYTDAWNDLFKFPFDYDLDIALDKLKEIKCQWVSRLDQLNLNHCDFNWKIVTGLHVHHRYYVKGKLPWEYKNEALTTLCMDCHEDLHKNQKVSVYSNELELIGELTNCYRCHGAGWFPEYLKIENGICFRCRGAKYEEIINATTG